MLDDQNDAPEEQRRQMEAKRAAQNLGAVIGLAAGVSAAVHHAVEEANDHDRAAPVMEQSMH